MANTVENERVQQFMRAFNDPRRILARLMACENITIKIDACATTSYFDMQTRVLTIPEWLSLSLDQLDMMTAHEVYHALYSSSTETLSWLRLPENKKKHSYWNTIEDARVERLGNIRYPGMKSIFKRAYAEFTERGPIAQLASRRHLRGERENIEISSLPCIDRLRVTRMCGDAADVCLYNDTERDFYDRMMTVTYPRQVFALVEDIIAYEQPNAQKSQPPSIDSLTTKTEHAPSNDAQSFEQGTNTPQNSDSDSDVANKTSIPPSILDKEFANQHKRLKETTVSDSNPIFTVNIPFHDEEILLNRIINVEQLIEGQRYLFFDAEQSAAALDEWRSKYSDIIRQMAVEFERKKSANCIRKAKVSKTGYINTEKLHAYKFCEDIFLRSLTVPAGQNHGIVVIVDHSSSIERIYQDMILQIMMLAEFAKRVRIPFVAYAFTDCQGYVADHELSGKFTNCIWPESNTKLVEMINTNKPNYKQQLEIILRQSNNRNSVGQLALGGTPLLSSLLVADAVVRKFKKQHHLEKVAFVMLTDGGDTNGMKTLGQDEFAKLRISPTMILQDTHTHKFYSLMNNEGAVSNITKESDMNAMTQVLCSVIADRNQAETIFIFIAAYDNMEYYLFALGASAAYPVPHVSDELRTSFTAVQKEFKDSGGICTLSNSKFGIAQHNILIRTSFLRLKTEEECIRNMFFSKKMSAEQITNTFVLGFKHVGQTRVFVRIMTPFLS